MRKREKVKMSLRKENSQPNSHQDFAEETNAVDLNFSDVFSAIEIPAGQKNDKSLDMASASATASDQKANTPTLKPLVQHCGPDCMMSQKIVDKLLSRMMRLENERSELLAANRSWAVQYDMMKERYLEQIESLKKEVTSLKREKEEKLQENKKETQEKRSNSSNIQDQLSALAHQAEVYKEDFLEERKARARAHSKLEEVKSELRREKKSRARLVAMLQQQTPPLSCEKTTPAVVG